MIKSEILKENLQENVECINENEYIEIMDNTVEKELNTLKRCGFFSSKDSKNIYFETYIVQNPVKNIVISHGFTENLEKYKELIYYFVNQQFSVYILDHRGHGKSYREVEDYSVTHVESYREYIDDFNTFIDKVIYPVTGGKNLVLYAHSMGGAIGVMYLEMYPDVFEKAVLSSPMLQINTGSIPEFLGNFVASMECLCGRGSKRMFVHNDFNPKERFEDSGALSPARYAYFFEKRLDHVEYQNYSGTYSWMRASNKCLKQILKSSNLMKIKIPVLLFRAGKDGTVKPKGQDVFINNVKDSRLVIAAESKHEIYMASNNILEPYLNKIFNFIFEK